MKEICSRCNNHVFPFDRKYALGKIWHRHCFSCNRCNKLLSDHSIAYHNGKLLCRDCYSFHKLPPPCVKPKERPTPRPRCEICNCRSVSSRNDKICGRCNRFKSIINSDITKTNQCSKSKCCDKNTSTLSNIKFCPSANSTCINKTTSTCSIPKNQSPTTSNLFKYFHNNDVPCSSKTSQNASTGYRTFINKKPCRQMPCEYLYKNNTKSSQFSSTPKCPSKNCSPKSSKYNETHNIGNSCYPESTRKCSEEKSNQSWLPKFTANSSLKDCQGNKFVVLALPILGEMEM